MFEGLDLARILDIVAREDDASLRHAVVLTDLAGQEYHARGLAELHERLGSIDIKQLPDGAFPHLASVLTVSAGTNLLQGPYARKSNWRALAQPWYAAAGLLAATVALVIVGQAAEFFALQREDRALTELVTARCQQAFAANRISSCTTAVQRSLSEAGAASSAVGESFLTTLSAVAESYSSNSRIEALSYRNNVMDLQVLVPDVPALDAFAQQITGTDRFDVRIQSANPGDNGVEGRLQVTGANQ